MTELDLDPELPESVFAYTPLADAVVYDYRTDQAPSPDVLNGILGTYAASWGFDHYFLPDLGDYGYLPMWPVREQLTTTVVYAPPSGQRPAGRLREGIALVQFPAAELDPELGSDGAAALPDGLGPLYGRGEQVVVQRDGTAVLLLSPNLSQQELQAVAERLVRADTAAVRVAIDQGGSTLVLPQGQAGAVALAEDAGFTIFVPIHVPSGLIPTPPTRPIGSERHARLVYRTVDNRVGLSVTMGPAGSGLDAVPGREGKTVSIRGGIEGHLLGLSKADGGPILWWVEGGTYVAISGEDLTEPDLVEVANHMVRVRPNPVGD